MNTLSWDCLELSHSTYLLLSAILDPYPIPGSRLGQGLELGLDLWQTIGLELELNDRTKIRVKMRIRLDLRIKLGLGLGLRLGLGLGVWSGIIKSKFC